MKKFSIIEYITSTDNKTYIGKISYTNVETLSKEKSRKFKSNPFKGFKSNPPVCGRHLLITYPRCSLSLQKCKDLLSSVFLNAENSILDLLFIREKHAPEDPVPITLKGELLCQFRVHVYLKVSKPVHIRFSNAYECNARSLDLFIELRSIRDTAFVCSADFQFLHRSRVEATVRSLVKNINLSNVNSEDFIMSSGLKSKFLRFKLNSPIYGKRFLITYPQYNLSLQECKKRLFSIFSKNSILEFFFVREKHTLDDPLLVDDRLLCEHRVHIYLEVLKPVNIERSCYLDYITMSASGLIRYPANFRSVYLSQVTATVQSLVKDIDLSAATSENFLISSNVKSKFLKFKPNPRIRGKQFLITYTKCSLSIQTCKEYLSSLFAKNSILEFLFVREKRAAVDGKLLYEYDVHIYLEVTKRVDIQRSTFLDLVTTCGIPITYHASFQSVTLSRVVPTVQSLVKDINLSNVNSEDFIMSSGLKLRLETR